MSTRFEGFPRRGLTFLRQLVTHNDRDWLEERREIYREDVRLPTLLLAEALNARFEKSAPAYVTLPTRAVPRLARDRRFSPDLPPYKTFTSALFGFGGEKLFDGTGFAVRVSAEGVTVGGGLFRPARDDLARVRDAVAERHDELLAILGRRPLTRLMGALQGAQLIRIPSGYERDHPAGDLLRHRQLFLETTLELDVAKSAALVNEAMKRFRVMLPFVDWLGDAIGRNYQTSS